MVLVQEKKAKQEKKVKKDEKKEVVNEVVVNEEVGDFDNDPNTEEQRLEFLKNSYMKDDVDDEEEEDSVVVFEYKGKKYLKSINDGTVYDMEQNEIGKWNEKQGMIELSDASDDECEEEEYD